MDELSDAELDEIVKEIGMTRNSFINFIVTYILDLLKNSLNNNKGSIMAKNKEWREDQKQLTRDILDRVDVLAFSFDCSGKNKGCTLNHLDGGDGYIKPMDALNYNYRIYDFETNALISTFDSIEALIKDGWKVST